MTINVIKTLNSVRKQSLRMVRIKSGFTSFTVCSFSMLGYTFYIGPAVEDEYVRYAIAGTSATVAVELMTHAIDTVNMRSKVINGAKIYVVPLVRFEGVAHLFKGIQAVLYGYVFSSMVYFYAYARLKDGISGRYQSNKDSLY